MFCKVEISGLFDSVLLFGDYKGKDKFGNYKIKILKCYSKRKFKIWKHDFFLFQTGYKENIFWHPGDEEDWKIKTGETVEFSNLKGSKITMSKKIEKEKIDEKIKFLEETAKKDGYKFRWTDLIQI